MPGEFQGAGPDEAGLKKDEEFDFREEAGEAIDGALAEMEKTHEELQLKELKEWRDGEFKDNMHMIIEAQQEICGQEGNHEACLDGARIYEEMFGEPFNGGEQQTEATPA